MRFCRSRAVIFAIAVSIIAAFISPVVVPMAASADGQLTVTLPDGSAPDELFTETTLIPGSTTEETLLISQNTEESVKTGIRFEPQSPSGPLHDDAELTIDGLGKSVTVPLRDVLDAQSPYWLGSLSPNDTATVTLGVHLPATAGNDTQREEARFRIIVTAQGESGTTPPPTPTTSPTPTTTPTDPGDPPGEDDSDSDGSAASEGSAQADVSADSEGSSDADGTDDPGGSLPRTGVSILTSLLVAVALLGAGFFAIRTGRRRSDSIRTDD